MNNTSHSYQYLQKEKTISKLFLIKLYQNFTFTLNLVDNDFING